VGRPDADQARKTVISDEVFLAPPVAQSQGPKPPGGSGVFVLEFRDIKGQPRSFTLRNGENTIGRSDSCEIAIEDASLSRSHAVITLREGKAFLRDLGSKNHTFIDNKKISGEVEVQSGTGIIFGLLEATLVMR
jgi:pSer/pThr/pTyr-binding forkhead associated (FHA) protein